MLPRLSMVMLLVLAACGDKGGDPPTATTSGPSSSARYAPSAGSSAAVAPSADTAASPHAGTYKGTFKSKRGEVTVPEGVKYPSWKDDPGGFEGDNTVELVVAPDGIITGTIRGALAGESGKLVIKGLADVDGFSFGVSPENASADDGMTGVVNGKIDAGVLEGELRASNASGKVVRAGSLALTRGGNRAK